ncbi:thioredoxin-like protein [Flammula alnicola]|nr:thioredoxin-like protein [Flammula alnicola]
MSIIKLYGRSLSSATRRAATIFAEKGVPFELIPIDTLHGEHKTPAYLEKHPFGQIPLLDDNGFLLYESRAIGRYIAEKYADQGPSLIPMELKAKALFEQAASSELANFDVLASRAVYEVVGKKRQGFTPDLDLFNDLVAKLLVKLDAYEVILSKQKYLAGDDITLVDLFHLPFGSSLAAFRSDIFETKPNVSRWFKEVSSRPSWQAVRDGARSTA